MKRLNYSTDRNRLGALTVWGARLLVQVVPYQCSSVSIRGQTYGFNYLGVFTGSTTARKYSSILKPVETIAMTEVNALIASGWSPPIRSAFQNRNRFPLNLNPRPPAGD
jgi:hypothetical protein